MAAPTFQQPGQQSLQAGRRRLERPTFPLNLVASPDPHTADNRRLVHIKTGNPFVHRLHRFLLHRCTASVGSLMSKKARKLRSVLKDIAALWRQ